MTPAAYCMLAALSPMLIIMDAELFNSDLLESCRRDDARELQTVYLPSLAEIAVIKRQIRAEKEAKEGGPSHLKMCASRGSSERTTAASAVNTHG